MGSVLRLRWRILRSMESARLEQDDMGFVLSHGYNNDGTVAGAGRLQLNSPEKRKFVTWRSI